MDSSKMIHPKNPGLINSQNLIWINDDSPQSGETLNLARQQQTVWIIDDTSSDDEDDRRTSKIKRWKPEEISEGTSKKSKVKMEGLISRDDVQDRVVCNICMEEQPRRKMFIANKCSHSYCCDCISKHIAAKIQQNIHSVTCPNMECKIVLDPEDCMPLVPRPVFDRWMASLSESFFPASQKFYCPFKDCSAMLVDDGGNVVTASECPSCHRLFCAQCKVSWHADKSCNEYQRLVKNISEADDMFVELVQNKKWTKCPSCTFYVEKTSGCSSIICRCGSRFCYGCGEKSCCCALNRGR